MNFLAPSNKTSVDPELERQRREAERQAAEEKAANERRKREEAIAFARGLRGRRSLLSSAGELGFPNTTLG